MPTLRTYQSEDVNAVIAAHRTYQRVIGRAATGLGKAVEMAALAAHYAKFGRVMILVDVKKLVRQLADTIEWFTGKRPGIEMGDDKADEGGGLHSTEADRIIVSTVQTQYAGGDGSERFHKFTPSEFSFLGLDECEIFVSRKDEEKRYRQVVDWYTEGNRALRMFGCTATPNRTDGVAMAHMFEHVAFDRDILWGINQGYLVPGRQAFVRVSLDFSTLSVRKNKNGDADYSDDEISAKILNETTLIELAKGIIAVAENRRSIIVCPTVDAAVAIADYLNGERKDCARSLFGKMRDEEKDATMDAHQRGDFQFLSSVMMLTKGYDDKKVSAVFNCRKTRSKRLYTQILGRGTRPLQGIIEGVEPADSRRAAIAASAKPNMVMVNMVGINDDVRDITMVDVLGQAEESAVVERAKKLEKEEGLSTDEALEKAEEEIGAERAEKNRAAEQAYEDMEAEEERKIRGKVDVKAHVEVEYHDELSGTSGAGQNSSGSISPRHLEILRRNKVPESAISRMTPEAAKQLTSQIIYRRKAGLSSYGQAKILQRYDYSKEQLHSMSYADASTAIDAIASNGWKRPVEEVTT